jgi:hypothetical protein
MVVHGERTGTKVPVRVERPVRAPRRWEWWAVAALVVLAAIVAVVAVIVVQTEEAGFVQEAIPEYEIDSPMPAHYPMSPAPPVAQVEWSRGSDANLDPDMPAWYQSEYHEDGFAVH